MRTTAECSASLAVGHRDCAEIVQRGAEARNTPQAVVGDDRARLTHEDAFGSVNRKEMESLMARGLDEGETVDVIIRGMLR